MSDQIEGLPKRSRSEAQSAKQSRRAFLWTAGAGGAAALWFAHRPLFAAAGASGGKGDLPAQVTIVAFGADGRLTGKSVVPRMVKSDDEWRQQLSPISFAVTREAATERPYTGQGWDEHGKGIYRCVCCDTALFRSETKFDSGTGWPSFWQPIAKENIVETSDRSLGVERVAVSCRECAAHLGHVFDDGPRPTGLRYCMNAAALRFVMLA